MIILKKWLLKLSPGLLLIGAAILFYRQIIRIGAADKLQKGTGNYNDVALRLYNAMTGWGTNFKLILEEVSKLKGFEQTAVYETFDKPKYGGNAFIFLQEYLGDEMDLIQWFKAELSDSQISELKVFWKSPKYPIN